MLPIQVREELGIMAMKEYSPFAKLQNWVGWLVGWLVLRHINSYRLFNAQFCLNMYQIDAV